MWWPHTMENTFIEEDTRNSVHKTKIPQCPSKKAPWDLTQFSQSPSPALLYFPESHWHSEISSLSKGILLLGKPEVTGHQIWAIRGLSHLGNLMFGQKNLHKTWCMSYVDGLCWCDEAANHQLPIAASYWIIQIGFWRGMLKHNAKFDADSLLYSLSHFECDSHTVHMLTQQHLPPR